MSERDPFEILAAVNPTTRLGESLAGDEQLLRSILETKRMAAPPKRHRRRWIAAGGAGVVVVAMAAFAFTREESPRDPTAVACYSDASREPASIVGLGRERDPVAACAQVWATGQFGTASIPELAACVNPDGAIAVIPGGPSVCSRLGWANWVGEFSDEEERLLAFQDALVETFGSRCVGKPEADVLIEDLIRQFGFDDWTLVVGRPLSDGEPCTLVGADPLIHQITILSRHRIDSDPPDSVPEP